jgi:hypothetical protein
LLSATATTELSNHLSQLVGVHAELAGHSIDHRRVLTKLLGHLLELAWTHTKLLGHLLKLLVVALTRLGSRLLGHAHLLLLLLGLG